MAAGGGLFLTRRFSDAFAVVNVGAAGVKVLGEKEWSVTEAALKSSSYMKLPRILDWLTGSIGFHHIHHVNSTIPFYRLREAMAAIPELQSPGTTTLRPSDIVKCFSLKLWDPNLGKMVGYPEESAEEQQPSAASA